MVPMYHGGAPVHFRSDLEADDLGDAGARHDQPRVHQRDQQTVDYR